MNRTRNKPGDQPDPFTHRSVVIHTIIDSLCDQGVLTDDEAKTLLAGVMVLSCNGRVNAKYLSIMNSIDYIAIAKSMMPPELLASTENVPNVGAPEKIKDMHLALTLFLEVIGSLPPGAMQRAGADMPTLTEAYAAARAAGFNFQP